MTRFLRLVGFCFFVAVLTLGTTACGDITGALFPVEVKLSGPDYAYGQRKFDLGFNPPSYTCEYVIYARASGGARSLVAHVEWVGAEIRVFENGEKTPSRRVTLDRSEINSLFGHLTTGHSVPSAPFVVEGASIPFRWEIEVTYFDPDADHTGKAKFSSQCLVVS